MQVNGMDVVNSESDEEIGESTDDEEDEPDFVDIEETADVEAVSSRPPADSGPEVSQSAIPISKSDEFTHRADAPEEAPVKRLANPSDPTPEEKEKHMTCHIPYRGWCPICVKARGREDAHYKQTKEQKEQGLPRVAMDYAETGEKADKSDERKLLCGRERWTKWTFCHPVTCKGLGDDRIVGKVVKTMGETGFTKMELKGDGEPALVQVQEAVKVRRQQETILKNPPAHDPQANGEAERAVQEAKAQIRCLKLGLEARIGAGFDASLPFMEWLIPHAADVINRCLVGEDGRTAYYRVHAKNFSAKVCELGEQVLALQKRKKKVTRKTSLATRWREATWAGFDTRSNEHLVVLAGGGMALKVRTVRMRPESERWSKKAIEEIVATPDAPNPTDPNQRMVKGARETKGADVEGTGGQDLPKVPVRHEVGLTREFKITDRLLQKFGFTPGCNGCEAKIDGGVKTAHSAECRRRLEAEMVMDENAKEIIERRDRRRTATTPPQDSVPAQVPIPEDPDDPIHVDEDGLEYEPDIDMAPTSAEEDDGENDVGQADASPATLVLEAEDVAPSQAKRMKIESLKFISKNVMIEETMKSGDLEETMTEEERVNRRDRIEKSLKAVLQNMIRDDVPMVNMLCNREVLKGMIDELDENYTRKLMRRFRKTSKHANKDAEQETVDVAEAYSPPRMATMAAALGFNPGFSMDLTTVNNEGKPLDLSDKKMQDAAIKQQDEQKPWLLVVSPPCTWFSTLMNWNIAKMDESKVRENMKQAIGHLAFAVLMCLRQAKAGRNSCSNIQQEPHRGRLRWRINCSLSKTVHE